MTNTGSGIVLTRLDSEGGAPRFFLLCGRSSGIWSFSKGHTEMHDEGCALRTAVRETHEETGLMVGLDYRLLPESQRFGKRPYWIGVVKQSALGRMRLAAAEHTIGGWFTLEEIGKLKANVDVRAWYKKASNANSNFRVRLDNAAATSTSLTSPTSPPSPLMPQMQHTHLCAPVCNAS